MPFEHRSQPLLSRQKFYFRVLRYTWFCILLIGVSLGVGVLGYNYFNSLGWLDSLVNASMILTGMGPVDSLHSDGAKWFASIYFYF
ncbi:MAG TPA: hypothetical protein VIM65_06635 [Cyclobacteriaceae bacterium]